MGFSIGPLVDREVETVVRQFIAMHFPGCQIEGISEVTGNSPYTEFDVWMDSPVIYKVVLINGWTPNQGYDNDLPIIGPFSPTHRTIDKVELKEVHLHSGVTLIPNNKTYHKLIEAVGLLKEAMSEID